MNLEHTLSLHGGGPGSGCRGPNCGRPPLSAGPEGDLKEGEYYHGTSIANARKILRSGIKTSRFGSVSTSIWKSDALFHARRASKEGDDIALIVVKHPGLREGKDAGEYSVPYSLGPETVQRVEYYHHLDSQDTPAFRVHKQK